MPSESISPKGHPNISFMVSLDFTSDTMCDLWVGNVIVASIEIIALDRPRNYAAQITGQRPDGVDPGPRFSIGLYESERTPERG